jgi:hypothetical protein
MDMTERTMNQRYSRRHIMAVFRIGTALAGVAAGMLAAAQPGQAAVTTPSSSALFSLQSASITESSGVAFAGGVYWTHNDGPANKFYAIDAKGRTLASFATPNQPTKGSDWEDLAVGTDERGVASLFIGDIGDNGKARKEIAVLRVTRPQVNTSKTDVAGTATGMVRYRLAYPDGAHDAESLLVQPGTNRIFVISKAAGGGIYAAPTKPSTTTVNKLTKIGTVTIPGATGAAFSTDGKRLVVRQYKNAAVYTVKDGNVTAAVKTKPVAFNMPSQSQGESISFGAGNATLVLTSEGKHTPVLTQRLPG